MRELFGLKCINSSGMFYGFFFTKLFPGEAERTDNKQMRKCFLDPLSYFSFASSAFSY